jgi:hypothetical protein
MSIVWYGLCPPIVHIWPARGYDRKVWLYEMMKNLLFARNAPGSAEPSSCSR